MSGFLKITDIEGDIVPGYGSYRGIFMPELTVNGDENVQQTNTEDFIIDIPEGWYLLGFPFDMSTVTKIQYRDSDGNFISEQTNIVHENVYFYYKTTTGHYVSLSNPNQSYVDQNYDLEIHSSINLDVLLADLVNDNNLIIAKDYSGAAFFPEYNFNGIGALSKYEGLQIKTNNACQLVFTASRNSKLVNNVIQYGSDYKIGDGWGIINFSNKNLVSAEEFCETFVENVIVFKDYIGRVYLPQYNFNGIGDLIPGNSYQIKIEENKFIDFFLAENE